MWLVPDFRDGESLIIFKVHHIVGDGLAFLLMLGGLQDDYDIKQWIQTSKPPSKCLSIMLTLLKPFTMTYAFLGFLFWSTDKNCLKDSGEIDGKKEQRHLQVF